MAIIVLAFHNADAINNMADLICSVVSYWSLSKV